MLKLAKKMREISVGALMEVYAQSCLERGRILCPHEREMRQIAAGEQDLYAYLTQDFFRVPGALCAVWEKDGKYVSVLRLEPYQDGLLLTGLETAPEHRRKGYAAKLMESVVREMGDVKIYSHISKENQASVRTHEACGFAVCLDYAVLIDGTVSRRYLTYCRG